MYGSEFKSLEEIRSTYSDHRDSLATAGLLTEEAEREITAAEDEAIKVFESNQNRSFATLDED